MVYIPKGVIHETAYPSAHSRMLINCTDEFLIGLPRPDFVVFRNKNVASEIRKIFDDIRDEYALDDRFSARIIEGFMQKLLALTARNENFYHNKPLANKYVESALEYIHANFDADITLTSLAEKYGITKEHLSRIFKKETGLNFSEYLTNLRLKKACEMLCFSNESVSEIAYSCGFNDSNYFSDRFKKIYNLTPSKYRKINREIL